MNKTKVLIADDQQLFRELLMAMLMQDDDIDVVGVASNGDEAIHLAFQHVPDIILLDINMPVKDGIETLEIMKKKNYKGKIVMLTTFEDADKIQKACSLGADGYLVKDIKPKALRLALQCICEDMVVFHEEVYQHMVKLMDREKEDKQVYINDYLLNKVDLAIIKGISEGKTNKEIGEVVCYSEGTIKNRVSKILAMTGLNDRTEVAVYALKHEII